MDRKIVVTGATGFIGKALVTRLSQQPGVEVIPISRSGGVDFCSPNWTRLLPNYAVDSIIHLAQSSRYREFPDGAEDMRLINIDATAALLEWARLHEVRQFIYASSGNVYKSSVNALSEMDLVEPESFYGATKICGEHIVNQYKKYFSVINTRLFGVYGPGQKRMLVANIIDRMCKQEEITLAAGTGLIFNPLYIDDCTNVMARLLTYDLPSRHLTLNVGGEKTYSLIGLIGLLETLFNVKANIRVTSQTPDVLVCNIAKLKEIFPDILFTDLFSGLERVFRKYNS